MIEVHRVQASGLRSLSQKGGNWESQSRYFVLERERERDKRWSRSSRNEQRHEERAALTKEKTRASKKNTTPSLLSPLSFLPPNFSILTLQSAPRTAHFSPTTGSLLDPRAIYAIVWTGAQRRARKICISREFTYNESVIKIHAALFHGIDARGIGLLRSNLLPRYEGYDASSTLRGRRVRF